MAGQIGDDGTGEQNDAVWAPRVTGAAGDSKKRRVTVAPGKQMRLVQPPAAAPVLIPDEIIAEILSKVPVKSLVRFWSVCKPWKSMICDPQFVKNHLQRSTSDAEFTYHQLVPQACFLRDNVVSCSVRSLLNNPSTIPENVRYPLKPKYDIVGSCNGLLCLVCDGESWSEKRVRLWNPSTRLRSRKSPSLFNQFRNYERYKTVFGFGYDQSTDTYKVVSVFRDRCPTSTVKVYSFGTCCWREIQSLPAVPAEWRKSGEFVSGTVNWLAARNVDSVGPWGTLSVDQHVIVSFDLARETCRELLLPDDLDKNSCVATTLGVLRDCLYVSQNYECTHFVVWQMMEYGVKESWTRLLNISYVDLEMRAYAYLEPLCMSEKGDVLMTTNVEDGKFVLYNLRNNRLERPGIQSNKSWFHSKVYVESLVSPSC